MKQSNICDRYRILLFTLVIVCCSSCQKNDTPIIPPTAQQITGAIRPVGISLSPAITKQIGSAGGTIQTPDAHLVITIPAGAVSTTTTFGIELISNTNLAALGNAYRLTPHGQQFAKPITLQFSYQHLSDSIAMQEALGTTFQDENGIWNFMGRDALDTINKTVSYKSTHFSDWALMPWLILNPHYSIASENDEVDIEALQYIPFKDCHCDDDDLIPRTDKGIPVGTPQPLDKKYVKAWKINGPGYLLAGNDNYAYYKAPGAIPQTYTTQVSLQLTSKHTLLLLSNIVLISKDLFEWRFNGGPWKKLDAKLVSLGNNRLGIAYISGNASLSMTFQARTLFLPWGNDDYSSNFNYFPENHNQVYMCFHKVDNADVVSGGGVTMTEVGKVGEYCAGSFTITPAGFYTVAGNKQTATATIEGRFKLKRY